MGQRVPPKYLQTRNGDEFRGLFHGSIATELSHGFPFYKHYINRSGLNHLSRALSLRNLVLGYECGRVFPAGVGPGSPSRDAVNWLPSRFSLSVETRRRFGWLRMMVFPGAHLFRAPIWWSSEGWRHARGREHCRGEPGSSLSGGYAPDSAKAEGSSIVDEPGEG